MSHECEVVTANEAAVALLRTVSSIIAKGFCVPIDGGGRMQFVSCEKNRREKSTGVFFITQSSLPD